MRFRPTLAALLAVASAFGLAASASATGPVRRQNTILRLVDESPCFNWEAAGFSTGYFQMYVDYLIDTTPTPNKVRPLYFSIVNHTNHTAQVNQFRHYYASGALNWWSNAPFVITAEGTGSTQGAGNLQNGTDDGVLPWDPDFTGVGGFSNKIHRPANSASTGVNVVSTYSPKLEPWWKPERTDGPIMLVDITSQGYRSTCFMFYGYA